MRLLLPRKDFRARCARLRFAAVAASLMVGLILTSAGSASALLITEVQFDPVAFGSDLGQEFVEIYNDEAAAIDLTGYSLGWGGADYTFGTHDLDAYGSLAPGAVLVIGGPSDATGFDFLPELENGFFVAAGVGIFDVESVSIAGATPVDALIYGTVFVLGNFNNLIDETGGVGAIDIVTANSTENAVLDAGGNWVTTTTPTPGSTPIPEPGTPLFLGLGLLVLALPRRSRAI